MDTKEVEVLKPYEVYRLTLEHYVDGETPIRIEEPIVVKMAVDRQYMPSAVCINQMLDMMREYVLRNFER